MSPWEDIDKLNRRITSGFTSLNERMDEIQDEHRTDIQKLRDEILERFDLVDDDHKSAKESHDHTARWIKIATAVATIITALSLIITPIMLALLGVGPK